MSKRTPYDTGKRSEPKPWHVQPRNLPDPEELDRYGKVDFEDDAGGTLATLYIEKDDDGSWVLRGYAWESLKLDVESNDPTDPDLAITVVAHDPEEPQVYWDMAHEGDDEHQPFGEDTARIIDLQQGGVIAYCHKDNADRLVRAVWLKEENNG